MSEALAARARRVNPFHRGGDDDDDDDSDDEMGMLTDDEAVSSPIDDVDPFIFFAETMQATHAADAAKFGALTGGLDAGGQATLQELMAHANVRREEIVKEKAEEAAKQAAGGQASLPQRH